MKLKHFLMDQAGTEGGSGGNTVDAAAARTYLAERLPFDDGIAALPDDKVIERYGVAKPAWDKIESQAAAKATENWRQGIAGDNAENLKTLERFASPKALYESYASLRSKMSSGELKANTPFPDKGTVDEQAQWRKDQGVPDKPEAYKLELKNGITVGDDVKPLIDNYLASAHAQNMHPSVVNANVQWYLEQRQKAVETQAQRVAELKQTTEDKLRAEWGTDYRGTMGKITGFLDSKIAADSPLKSQIMASAETNPEFANLLASIALELNPGGTLVAGDPGAQVGSVTDKLTELDKLMRTDRKAYDKRSAEYQPLAAAYQRMTGKDWGRK